MGLADAFQNLGQDQNSPSDYLKILKELSDKTNQTRFSELSDTEIKIFSRLTFLRTLLKEKYEWDVLNIDKLRDTFLELRFNKDRASRKEFVDSFKGERSNDLQRGIIKNMFGNDRFVR